MGNYRVGAILARLFPARYPRFVNSESALVIEGFPRSGNSYLAAAFHEWNRGVKVSHHTHLASNVIEAARMGMPAAVLIRHPVDAVASAIVWDGNLTPTVGLLFYIHFYRRLWKCRDKIQVLSFEQVIERPDRCFQGLNCRFGSDFKTKYFDTRELEAIQQRLRKRDIALGNDTHASTMPNKVKMDAKLEINYRIRNNPLIGMALDVYDQYSKLAGSEISET